MKRYIITGGLGFVGSHLVEKLVKLNKPLVPVLTDKEIMKDQNGFTIVKAMAE